MLTVCSTRCVSGSGRFVERQRHESHPRVPARIHPQQFHAEFLLVVHVHDAPVDDVQWKAIGPCAGRPAATVRIHHLAHPAVAEGDIEDALVADAVPLGPRLADGIEVLHQFDQHVARVEHDAASGGAVQSPERFVLRAPQRRRRLRHAERAHEEALRLLEIGNGQRHRARRHTAVRPRITGVAAQRVVFHDFDEHALGIAHAHSTLAGLADRRREWRRTERRKSLERLSRNPAPRIRRANSRYRTAGSRQASIVRAGPRTGTARSGSARCDRPATSRSTRRPAAPARAVRPSRGRTACRRPE